LHTFPAAVFVFFLATHCPFLFMWSPEPQPSFATTGEGTARQSAMAQAHETSLIIVHSRQTVFAGD
jgi:hypothetical protein